MILVVGATGHLGSEICKRLKAGGESVRGFVRPGAKREQELKDLGVEMAYGDLKDPASIEKACQGVDAVICTATCILSHRRGDSFKKVDHDGLLELVEAATRSGVRYFQFMSISPHAPFQHPFADYKRAVERAVRDSGMTWSVLQPGPFMETQFSKLAGWNLEKGKVRLGGPGNQKSSPISLQDVADFAIEAYRNPSLHNRDLPLDGPDSITPRDAIRAFEKALGRPLEITKSPPVQVFKLVKFVVRPFNPHMASVLDLITSARRPTGDVGEVTDMTETAKLLPRPLTSVEDYAKKAVALLSSKPSRGNSE